MLFHVPCQTFLSLIFLRLILSHALLLCLFLRCLLLGDLAIVVNNLNVPFLGVNPCRRLLCLPFLIHDDDHRDRVNLQGHADIGAHMTVNLIEFHIGGLRVGSSLVRIDDFLENPTVPAPRGEELDELAMTGVIECLVPNRASEEVGVPLLEPFNTHHCSHQSHDNQYPH